MKRLALAAAVLFLFSVPARAAIIFSDDFNTEHGGVGILNYNSFNNFTVTAGTVDLIGNGYFDFLPGNGLYVDLDGSTNDAGLLTSNALALAAGSYVLSFDLAGSHRGQAETVDALVFGGADPSYAALQIVHASGDPFTRVAMSFIVPAGGDLVSFSFQDPSRDNIGMLLDNVELQSVPEPATCLLFAAGLAAAWRRSATRA